MYQFKTKAQTLKKIYDDCADVNVLPVYIVNSSLLNEENAKDLTDKIQNILAEINTSELVVRSSCSKEDTMLTSAAGKYDSKLHVKPAISELEKALRDVYASYETTDDEEILIQPMLADIVKSGVIFTRDIYTLSPYYIIDYFVGSDSAAITSGTVTKDHIHLVYRHRLKTEDKDINALLSTVKRIEAFFDCESLDIEFGINGRGEVYIFQVRPIANHSKKCAVADGELDFPLEGISKKINKLMKPRPFLVGETTYFGVMPDWNPAEILGIRPKKLAISLYKELVTDTIWSQQRVNYGYRDLTRNPLMVLFCGIPYIDTRITFNSFVPDTLSDSIAQKLVDYYLLRLKKHPSYHDKIEFEIVFSCYYLGLSEDLKKLTGYGFNENECKRIEYALLNLTNRIIDPQTGLYKEDIKKIELLKENHQRILESDMSTVEKIYWLIEECKIHGTLPFSGVARAAFIAVQQMRAFVRQGIISQNDYDNYMESLNTISKQMGIDKHGMETGEITQEEFLEKYGHIRPGTYDIEYPRYDEAWEHYFGKEIEGEETCRNKMREICETTTSKADFSFSKEQMSAIDRELEENGVVVTASELLQFIKESIEGREYLKFVFTKTVSEILHQIELYGKRLDIRREELAYLDIGVVKELYSDLYYANIKDVFEDNIRRNRNQYAVACAIKLPTLITSPKDVFEFELLEEEPNFVTTKSILGRVITEDELYDGQLEGKIVFIKSADPGYDYLFPKKIGGLVTQFGGANSHMALRCSELGIPAVIGAGEQNFVKWREAGTLLIDAKNKQVKVM